MDNVNRKSKFSRHLRNRLNNSLTIINTLSLDTFEEPNSQLNTSDVPKSNSINELDINFDSISYNDNNSNIDECINSRNLNCENVQRVDISTNHVNIVQNKEDFFYLKLQKWAIDKNVSHSTLNSLLSILRAEPGYNYLPKDARTFLKTPNDTLGKKLGSGLYYYFGIKNTLNNLCNKENIIINLNQEILLAANIDGLPVSKSTNSSFWPILCTVKSVDKIKNKVFMVALYHGNVKPDANEFLTDFVNECVELSQNGIYINSIRYHFKLTMLICDTPAKSYILAIKGHSGYFSCTKCDIEGDMANRVMCFVDTENLHKRSDYSFRNKVQPDHHIGTTILLKIPNFNIIDNVPIDYMHCLLLGGMKHFLCNKVYGWIYGRPPYKLRARDVNKISEHLLKLKKHIPCEFSRKTRPITECKRYKATEFRLLLLYTGPIILKDVISSKMYNNFIVLSLASSILISQYYSCYEKYISYAYDLFKYFIINSQKLYGPEFISYNIHNFLHLSDCVRLFGSLDNFSAFVFENYMQYLKNKIRKSSHVLEQVVRRIVEENNITDFFTEPINASRKYSIEHNKGPLIKGCTSPQYKKYQTINYCIHVSKEADRFIELKDKTIVEVKNLCYYKNCEVLLGYEYKRHKDFYIKPCSSTLFDIQYIRKIDNSLKMWPITYLNKKLVVLIHNNQYVSFPMLHL